MTPSSTPNVVLFGATGAGKSSVMNMLLGADVVKTSSSPDGCTFENTPHIVDLDGQSFRIFDTVGLNEGSDGKVPTKDAIAGLYKLIKELKDGLSLLVLCIRVHGKEKVKKSTQNNYEMFYSALCQAKVPIVIVILGLENMGPDMELWWRVHQKEFLRWEMHFTDHVCGTAVRGPNNCFEGEYKETRKKLRDMIKRSYLDDPWQMEPTNFFLTAAKKIWNGIIKLFGMASIRRELADALQKGAGMPASEAIRFANEIA
jgi:GTPase Era involved in 16S rRNA processing